VSIVDPLNLVSRDVAAKVHTTMREFTLANNQKVMWLYSTERTDDA
jgi:hypothetical protein